MAEENLDYEAALRALLGLVGKPVVVGFHGEDRRVAARFSGLLQHARPETLLDSFYADVGLTPPEALFFTVNPWHALPGELIDVGRVFGFGVSKGSFDAGRWVKGSLFIDAGSVTLVIRESPA
jgi:hypothetical protein